MIRYFGANSSLKEECLDNVIDLERDSNIISTIVNSVFFRTEKGYAKHNLVA